MIKLSRTKATLFVSALVFTPLLAAQGTGTVVESRPIVLGQASSAPEAGSSSTNDALQLLLDQNSQLQAEVQALRGMVEEQSFELMKLQRDSMNRYQDTDGRLQSLETALASAANPASGNRNSGAPAANSSTNAIATPSGIAVGNTNTASSGAGSLPASANTGADIGTVGGTANVGTGVGTGTVSGFSTGAGSSGSAGIGITDNTNIATGNGTNTGVGFGGSSAGTGRVASTNTSTGNGTDTRAGFGGSSNATTGTDTGVDSTRMPARPATGVRNPNSGGRGGLQPAVLSEQQLYQMAYDSVINRNFERAVAEFDQYLSIYPQGRFVTNGHYWKGLANLNLNAYAQARESFEIILNDFPESNKLPDAMYGLAQAYQGLGNVRQARQLLNRIKRQFPNTGVANLADTLLLSLD